MILGRITTGTATLTSNFLRVRIHDDDHNSDSSEDSDDSSDKSTEHENSTDKHSKGSRKAVTQDFPEINMIGATHELDTIKDGFKAIKNKEGKVTGSDHKFVYIIRGFEADIAIDLIFNKVTALKQFNNWRKCLEEIDDINAQKKMNRLAEAKNSVMQSNMGKQETGQYTNNGINAPAMPEPRMSKPPRHLPSDVPSISTFSSQKVPPPIPCHSLKSPGKVKSFNVNKTSPVSIQSPLPPLPAKPKSSNLVSPPPIPGRNDVKSKGI